MHKEIIEIEVIQNSLMEYKPKGNISYKCPCCEHWTEIILKGLNGDASIIPSVKMRWWWELEQRVIRRSGRERKPLLGIK